MTNIFDAIEKRDLELVKALIEAGANLEEYNDDGLLPIHLAAINNNFEMVKLLIENGADINAESSKGVSLAHIVAGHFSPEQLDWLFDKGMDINVGGFYHILPIHIGAMGGSLENVKWFFDKGAEDKTVEGLSVLHMAVGGNFDRFLQSIKNGTDFRDNLKAISDEELPKHFDLLKYLLDEKGYDVNTPKLSMTINNARIMDFLKERGADICKNVKESIYTATENGYVEVIKWFVTQGVDISKMCDDSYMELISQAVQEGQIDLVRYLFDLGIDINYMNLAVSALMSDKPEMIELLSAKGCDFNTLDTNGSNPILSATYSGKINSLKYLAEKEVEINLENLDLRNNPKLTIELIQWLQSQGYDIKKEGHSLMHCAAYRGKTDIIEYLLSEGLDVNVKDEEGKTPIYYATKKGRFESIKYLYERGADLKIKDNDENTLMHIAAKKGRMHIIQWLLDQDIPIDVANSEGKTPVNSAAQKGRLKVIEFLGKKGADISNIESYAQDLIQYAAFEQDVSKITWLKEQGMDISNLTFTVSSKRVYLSPSVIMKASEWISQYGVKITLYDNQVEYLITQAAIDRDEKIIEWLQNHINDNQKYFVISGSPGYFRSVENLIEGTYWLIEKGIKVKITGEAIRDIILSNQEKVGKITKFFDSLGVTIEDFADHKDAIISSVADKVIVRLINWIQKCGGVVDPNAVDSYDHNLIHRAVQNNRIEMLKWCIENRGDIDAKSPNGTSPLHIAFSYNNLQCINLLLENGADPNLVDNYGNTPLSKALNGNKLQVVNLLLENGADPNLVDSNGNTPLFNALYTDKIQYAKLLLEHGADLNAPNNHGSTPLLSAVYVNKTEMISLLCSFKANIDLENLSVRSYFTNQDNFQPLLNQGTLVEQITAGMHIVASLKANPQMQARGNALEEVLVSKINRARPDILDNLDLLDTRTNLKAILINLDKCKALEGLKEKIQDFDHESPSFRSLGFLTDIEKLNLTQSLEVKERELMAVATNVENDGSATSNAMHNPGIVEHINSFLSREDQVNLFVSPVAHDDQTDNADELAENPQVETTGEE
ncbi:ANK repeat containing protein [Candidatus Phycorickettsia trachydisci]|uniref:ANK repeat containing protein n=1 Tax=Candidatus Phycorickettsia trachydisci TaxID=2115978 RepID=A0A2P1P8L3_9RICK|nr:ankyrin repeat domain-containing protein [Candidatus Phycorickettsia trachydisci]AVP87597.1 ANK repeat containing protein [Candidatus Phycorickettsia trachydisci]